MKTMISYLILKLNINAILRMSVVFFLCFLPAITIYFLFEYQKFILWTTIFILTPFIYGIGLSYFFSTWFKCSKISIFLLGLLSICLLLIVSTVVGQHGIVSEASVVIIYTFMFAMHFSCGLIWSLNKDNFFQILASFWYFVTFICNLILFLFIWE